MGFKVKMSKRNQKTYIIRWVTTSACHATSPIEADFSSGTRESLVEKAAKQTQHDLAHTKAAQNVLKLSADRTRDDVMDLRKEFDALATEESKSQIALKTEVLSALSQNQEDIIKTEARGVAPDCF